MLTELIRESQRTALLRFFGKEEKEFKKTQWIMGALFGLVGIMLLLIVKKPTLAFIPFLTFFVGYKYPYFKLLSNKKSEDTLNSYLFPEFIQSFLALLPTSGNVYQTLKATIRYTKDPLRSKLIQLVEKIEEDNDRQYYLEFAEMVNTSEAFMVMDMIYQFSEYGVKKEALKELQSYIGEIHKNRVNEIIDRKMGQMEYIGFLPIFISILTVIVFAGALFWHYWQGVTSVAGGL